MNWLLMIVLGIILMGAVIGAIRGALRITVSIVATVVTLLAVVFVTPYVSETLMALTPVDEVIESQCLEVIGRSMSGKSTASSRTEEQVRSMLKGAGVSEEELAAAGITVEDIVNGEVDGNDLAEYGISKNILNGHMNTSEETYTIFSLELPRQMQIEAIEKSGLPDVFKDLLISNNNDEVYEVLGATTFGEYVGKYFARIIINICSFCLSFFVVTILVRAIIFALDIITMLPGLGLINRVTGMFFGIAIALVVIEFLFVGITMLYNSMIGAQFLGMIDQSALLSFLYENNIVMKLMTKLW